MKLTQGLTRGKGHSNGKYNNSFHQQHVEVWNNIRNRPDIRQVEFYLKYETFLIKYRSREKKEPVHLVGWLFCLLHENQGEGGQIFRLSYEKQWAE